MTYMGGSVSALVTDRNTWQARANAAWGRSGTWNSGDSWQTELTAMTASRDAWQAAYNTKVAELTAMTNDRNYWQHTVAHNDPNVWTNQYNAGHTAGHAAGYAAAVAAVGVGAEHYTSINPNGTPPGYGGPYEQGRITLPGPGTAGEFMVAFRLHLTGQWEESGGNALLHILVQGPSISHDRTLTSGFAGTSGNINVVSGDGQIWHITATGGQQVIFYLDSWQCDQTNYNAVLAAHRIWNTTYPH